MTRCVYVPVFAAFILALILTPTALAIQPADPGQQKGLELAVFEKARTGGAIGVGTRRSVSLPEGHALRTGWDSFLAEQKGDWTVRLDTRSGLPALAEGKGIPWVPGAGNGLKGAAASVPRLEQLAREFLAARPELLGNWEGQMVLDKEATIQRTDRVWQVAFRQVVNGIPVDGSRYSFLISNGNLVSFGASRWGQVLADAVPAITVEEARANLNTYLGLGGPHHYVDLQDPNLHLVALDPAGKSGGTWNGALGEGYGHVLVYRFTFANPEFDPTWVGEVDARNGEIVSFFNDTKYDRIRGWISPISDDGDCARGGCLTDGYPMPFADYSINGGVDQTANEHGLYECATLGDTIETNLHGPYIYLNDQCGAVSASVTCDGELDLGISAGINCSVAAGASPGNTDAARSAFYSIGRVIQKAQYWMPSNTWLQNTLQIRTNVNSTCNATWGGTLNMYRAGNGCGNTGQLQGVLVHEWGHGMDQNDGGGYDNPSEAYADVVAIFESRESCVGRGFRTSSQCSGYGDTCLDCTGIRDMDWDKRTQHTPATPTGFLAINCPSGSGPCGKETHCAAYVPGEAMFDLAYRDLPASGLDAETSWQLAERLFYESRPGSGGNTYNCSLPSSDSCGVGSWFQQLRVQDDDDGDLANGTPHAAALFAAFDRHDIACGVASDPEHQNSGSCPTLNAPIVTAKALTNTVELNWDAVAGASSYRIYRNEHGCDRSQVPLAEVTGTTWRDNGLVNDLPEFYRVEAIAANSACTGALSTCLEASAQPLAGFVLFSRQAYACQDFDILMRVTDANHVGNTMTVTVWSDAEVVPETVTLTETSTGSAKFEGIITTTLAAAAADGLISVSNGAVITAEYLDADDGDGGINVPIQSTTVADCAGPIISGVGEQNITDSSATVIWTTSEPSDTELLWGENSPPTTSAGGAAGVTEHQVNLSGLQSCTVYFFEVQSTDPSGNSASDNNGGQYFYFETFGDFGQGLQPCHAGRMDLGAATYACGETLTFQLIDQDLNTDPGLIDTINVTFSSSTEIAPESVLATETASNSSTFTGSIALSTGAPAADGVLQVSSGDLVTGTYRDQDDGTGASAVVFTSAAMDCGPPKIQNLKVSGLTDQRFTIRFDTSEPGDTLIEWGTTTGLGNTSSSTALTTSHSMSVNTADICQQFYFRVSSTDAYGNTAVADAEGSPYPFSTLDIPGLYYRETFENGVNGWDLNGDFEIGSPQGLGVSAGYKDPTTAYNNAGVLGNDLSGLGSHAGDYEHDLSPTASTPTLDARTWTNVELRIISYLNVRNHDRATIDVTGSGQSGGPVYNSSGLIVADNDYSLRVYDISALMDGERSTGIEFGIVADDQVPFVDDGIASGWNVDDLILKDGTLPAMGACGTCSTAPSFVGATSAMDSNACGAGGVTVSWNAAIGWGSGGVGTYAVYRDTAPGFTPGAGNLVGSGIAGLSYVDMSAVDGPQYYYLVRAESDETCGSGPNNGGGVDTNTVYLATTTSSTQGVPDLISEMKIDLVNYAHVRLNWPAMADAVSYRVYRSASPDPATFILLTETNGLSYEDAGEGGTFNNYYYKVQGVNACDQEGL